MIDGLQGKFGDLDIKYLKQNISKCQSQISGSFRRTPRHCTKYLWNSPGKRYQMIRICVTGEVETLSSPIRRQNSGCETSGWNGGAVEFRMWYIRVEWRRQQNSECDTSGVESGGSRMEFLPGWNELWFLSGWNEQDPILLVFWICLWIPKNSPQSRIALVIKKLSKHQNLTQFD